MTNNRETNVIEMRPEPMLPNHQSIHVAYRREALAGEAAAQRTALAQRQFHVEEHETHPTLVHQHPATGVRAAVGRLLIGLGTVIAGDEAPAGARPAA